VCLQFYGLSTPECISGFLCRKLSSSILLSSQSLALDAIGSLHVELSISVVPDDTKYMCSDSNRVGKGAMPR
jgi:hypothetical protein